MSENESVPLLEIDRKIKLIEMVWAVEFVRSVAEIRRCGGRTTKEMARLAHQSADEISMLAAKELEDGDL